MEYYLSQPDAEVASTACHVQSWMKICERIGESHNDDDDDDYDNDDDYDDDNDDDDDDENTQE